MIPHFNWIKIIHIAIHKMVSIVIKIMVRIATNLMEINAL